MASATVAMPVMYLHLPKYTDIRGQFSAGGADVVEVPAGSGRLYNVSWYDDRNKGQPSEYRFAVIVQQNPFLGGVMPVISAMSVHAGPIAGGTSVTLTGMGFTSASQVWFGVIPAASFSVGSDTSITATSPAESAGTVQVSVVTPIGTTVANSATGFAFDNRPVVSGVSPAYGPVAGGTSVTINGTGFTGATVVDFGGTPAASFSVGSDTSITATSPAESAATVDITVTTPGGISVTSGADQFQFLSAPTVSGLGTTSGSTSGGTSVVITGTNFVAVSQVMFGSTAAASYVVNSSTQITAVTPAESAATVDTTVTTPGGTSAMSGADQFTFSAGGGMVIQAVRGTASGAGSFMINWPSPTTAGSILICVFQYDTFSPTNGGFGGTYTGRGSAVSVGTQFVGEWMSGASSRSSDSFGVSFGSADFDWIAVEVSPPAGFSGSPSSAEGTGASGSSTTAAASISSSHTPGVDLFAAASGIGGPNITSPTNSFMDVLPSSPGPVSLAVKYSSGSADSSSATLASSASWVAQVATIG